MVQERDDQQEIRAVLDAIRNIVRALRLSSRACEREFGLSVAQIFVLQQLDREEGISLNDLAERTLTHQSSVSVVVSKLVDRGLVLRRPAKEDSRRAELFLTSQGRKMLANAPRAAQEELMTAIAKMEPARRMMLAELLAEVVAIAGFAVDTAPPLLMEEDKAT